MIPNLLGDDMDLETYKLGTTYNYKREPIYKNNTWYLEGESKYKYKDSEEKWMNFLNNCFMLKKAKEAAEKIEMKAKMGKNLILNMYVKECLKINQKLEWRVIYEASLDEYMNLPDKIIEEFRRELRQNMTKIDSEIMIIGLGEDMIKQKIKLMMKIKLLKEKQLDFTFQLLPSNDLELKKLELEIEDLNKKMEQHKTSYENWKDFK